MSVRFPYLAVASARGDSALTPLLPIELWVQNQTPIRTHELLDSGATVNVLPYALGLQIGAIWEAQKTTVTLTGNLALHEARALILEGRVTNFPPVRLVFAWSRAEHVPLIPGQVNFFEHFNVSFRGVQRQFETEPARE